MRRSFLNPVKISMHQNKGCRYGAVLRVSDSTASWGEPNKSRSLLLGFFRSIPGPFTANEGVEQVPGAEILQRPSCG